MKMHKLVCQLDDDHNSCFPRLAPSASWRRRAKRAWRHMVLIGPTLAAKQHFHSTAALQAERSRHIRHYPHTIHPFSLLVLYKQWLMTAVYTCVFLIDPCLWAFGQWSHRTTNLTAFDCSIIALDAVWLLDTVVNCFVGHYVEECSMVELGLRRTFLRHLRTYLPFDLLGALCSILRHGLIGALALGQRINLVLMVLPLLRYVRVSSCVRNIGPLLLQAHAPEGLAGCAQLAWLTALLLHVCACAIYAVHVLTPVFGGSAPTDSWTREAHAASADPSLTNAEKYVAALFLVVCHFFGCGTGGPIIRNQAEMAVMAAVTMAGFLFYVFAVGHLLELFGVTHVAQNEFETHLNELRSYARSKHLPDTIYDKLRMYYVHKFQNKHCFEEKDLSTALRKEMLHFRFSEFVRKVYIFQHFPRDARERVLHNMRQSFYLAGDVILNEDNYSNEINFISYGTVMFLYKGREIYHMEDGDHFGDAMALLKRRNFDMPSTVALEPCEIYSVETGKMEKCLRDYPEILEMMNQYAEDKFQHFLCILKEENLFD